MNLAYDPARGRSPWTKWAGIAAVFGLPLGYAIINGRWEAGIPLAIISLVGGFTGYVMTVRSLYAQNRRRKCAAILDERESRVFERANAYAFRALAILILLFLLYATVATEPERQWWLPRSTKDWWSLILPMSLVLPIIPTVIAEWLDPTSSAADGED